MFLRRHSKVSLLSGSAAWEVCPCFILPLVWFYLLTFLSYPSCYCCYSRLYSILVIINKTQSTACLALEYQQTGNAIAKKTKRSFPKCSDNWISTSACAVIGHCMTYIGYGYQWYSTNVTGHFALHLPLLWIHHRHTVVVLMISVKQWQWILEPWIGCGIFCST